MKIVEKPWGHEEIWAQTDRYVGKILHIKQGHRLSLQYHEEKTETIRVLSGQLTLTIGDTIQEKQYLFEQVLLEGESFHISAGTVHRMACYAEGGCQVLEVSTPELDDVVRLADDYKR